MNARTARRCRFAAKAQAEGLPDRAYRTLAGGQIVLRAQTVRRELHELKRLARRWGRTLGARYRVSSIGPLPF